MLSSAEICILSFYPIIQLLILVIILPYLFVLALTLCTNAVVTSTEHALLAVRHVNGVHGGTVN